MIAQPRPEALWSAAEASAATAGSASADWAATGVSIDSRTLAPGDLFVALAGPRFDGHDFVAAAFAAGAAAAMVHRDPPGAAPGMPLLRVGDTLAGLTALGRAARSRAAARFVAVTGSVGKTGTKEALRLALAAQAPTHATVGNLNNQWGVPLSLARMPRDARYGVFEIGMNHAGEIGPLSRLVRPQVAVITAVAPVHLAFFPSVEAIADAKAEIFEGLEASGTAVLNRDSPFFDRLADRARSQGAGRILGFGRDPRAEARLVDCSLHATCSAVTAVVLGERLDYCLGLAGEHWVLNSLAVLAAVRALGGDLAAAAAALAGLRPLKGRGQRSRIVLPAGSFELIDESYNANPASMRAALLVLGRSRPGGAGRRIAALGDMLELGPEAARLHADLAAEAEAAGIDLVFTAGPLMAALHEALPPRRRGGHAPTAARLAEAIAGTVAPGDVVLVKGSLGSRMAAVVEALQALGAEAAPPRAANGR